MFCHQYPFDGISFTWFGQFVLLIMLLPLFLRERPGERLLPWSTGEASVEALASVNESWRDIIVTLLRALILPMSLLLIFLEGLQRAAAGILLSINPVITVQELGWAQTEFANWVAITGIVGITCASCGQD